MGRAIVRTLVSGAHKLIATCAHSVKLLGARKITFFNIYHGVGGGVWGINMHPMGLFCIHLIKISLD